VSKLKKFEEFVGVETDLFLKYWDKYYQYKKRAKTKGLKFLVSFERFYSLLTAKCYICDLDGRKNELGIDRLNNKKGYTEFNIVGCCWDCNRMKSDMTMSEFSVYIKRINPEHKLAKMFDKYREVNEKK